jgi:AcrR family transcriptional regulator
VRGVAAKAPATRLPEGTVPSAAKTRIVSAAIALFAEHGVGGTSLQMIADAVGVTKAAVYHQFNTKDEIVIAVAEDELARLEAFIAVAEAEPSRARAREVLVDGIIDFAVERGRLTNTVQRDPVIVRFFAQHPHYRSVMDRLYALLMGNDERPLARTTAAMLTAAIAGAATHPIVADLDDETLRRQLRRLARRFLNLPE